MDMADSNTLELTMEADIGIAASIVSGALSRIKNIFYVSGLDGTRYSTRLDYREPIDPMIPDGAFRTTPSQVQATLEQLSLHSARVRISYNGAPRDAKTARLIHSGIYDSYLDYQKRVQALPEPFL